MTFEEYLISKKIDRESFQKAEPTLFESWKNEFALLHPNSFTSQKLYLVNPIRRKYPLKIVPAVVQEEKEQTVSANETTPVIPLKPEITSNPEAQPPKPARPVFKPKPKIS